MSLDQNAISLQPTKFHAIPTMSPNGLYWYPPLILHCDFVHPYYFKKVCAICSKSAIHVLLSILQISLRTHFLRMEDPPKLKPRSSSFPSFLVPCSSLSHWVLLGLHILLMLWARLPFYLKPKPSVFCPHGLDFLCIHGLGPLSHFGP